MSCWKNEDDLNHQQNKFMEYSIKSKITNASEEDIRQFHWENIRYINALILSPSENNSRPLASRSPHIASRSPHVGCVLQGTHAVSCSNDLSGRLKKLSDGLTKSGAVSLVVP